MKKLTFTFILCILIHLTFAQDVNIDIKVYLEGAFNGIDMNTVLIDEGVLPINQPYDIVPWNYDGTETIIAPPETDIVDWVYVEFRETDGDASTATPDKFLDHQAAVLLADGSIVQPDGASPILYTGIITQNLFVIVYHRNHLAVMSATALINIAGTYAYDFTDALLKAYLYGQKDLTGGYFGMIGGDSDGSGTINISDKNMHWTLDVGDYGYYESDLNLDSQINNPDKNDLWEANFGETSKVPGFVCGDTFIDGRDGQTYSTVLIGTQCWMAENLNIGTMINGSNNQSNNDTIEKYCYNNDPVNCETYGGLYQWNEMMKYISVEGVKGICPLGWHVPSDNELCILTLEVDPTVNCSATSWSGTDVGTKLKNGGSSGFDALYSGKRNPNGSFDNLGSNIWILTCSKENNYPWYRRLTAFYPSNALIERYNSGNANSRGQSVRCLRD